MCVCVCPWQPSFLLRRMLTAGNRVQVRVSGVGCMGGECVCVCALGNLAACFQDCWQAG